MIMCVRPIVVAGNIVPCGRCFDCLRQDRMNWSIRVQDEIKSGLFVTLTYAPQYYNGTVSKKELQKFIKRVREKVRQDDPKFNLKYFGVGEFGGRFGRGHYHVIINITDPAYIRSSWKKGIIHIGKISYASVHYCTKYVQKQIKQNKKQKREFRLMSKGLGKNYIERYGKHHLDNLLLHRVVNNKSYSMPRYYKEKIFKNNEKQYSKEYRIEQEKQVQKRLQKLIDLYTGLLRKEIDELKILKYQKQLERFKTLELLNSINLKNLNK